MHQHSANNKAKTPNALLKPKEREIKNKRSRPHSCLNSCSLPPFLDDAAAAVSGALDIFAGHGLALEQVDVAVVDSAARKHHSVRVEGRGCNGSCAWRVAHAQITHIRLEAGQVLEAGVVDSDGMICTSSGKDRRVLVH
jgi:hypothetical protein